MSQEQQKVLAGSMALTERALEVIPGGVNSPVRAFSAVGGGPVFIERGHGSKVWDVDGNEYIDFLCSWGPLILGHANGEVLRAVERAARRGTSFGASTEREVEFAELLVSLVPSLEKVRLVNSGTEATMSALRLARGATGRDKVVKVEGGYHGHMDGLLVRAGSGGETFGVPDSAGVPAGTAADTLTIPYNDPAAARRLFEELGDQIAAMIIEPVAGNMGVVPPVQGYLKELRDLTRKAGSLLIFDEVISGLRLGLGGAQQRFGVLPDLTCLGKVIGGGLPVGAYGGAAALMDQVSPDGPVYQAGTLSGNPLAVAAGLATVRILVRDDPYPTLERLAAQLSEGMEAVADDTGVELSCNRVGSMATCFFTDRPVVDLASAKTSDTQLFGRFHREMLRRGVYLAPSQFEATFVSTAHQPEDIDRTLGAALDALRNL
jgi:glutamate-1-semialdehyde 2,1-aminomutase